MGNNLFTYVQIGTVLSFIGTLFVLYRLYIEQKDATIQLLKEKNEWLQKQLDVAKESSPDVLMKTLNDRVKILTDEIERLSKDKLGNETLIRQKDEELKEYQEGMDAIAKKLDRWAKGIKTLPPIKSTLTVEASKEKPPAH